MTATIERYIPDATEIYDEDIVAFTTMDDLQAIPFVAAFTHEPDFHRFSLEPWGSRNLLMAEFNEGRRWQAVGLITGPAPELPKWTPVR